MSQMKDQAFGALDPQILSVFLDRLMQSLLGKKVMLNDGRIATIRMIHPQDPLHPLVQVDQEFLDLSQQSSTKIKQVIAS
jgi:HD-GYP domain-containing protein (c-di-GMP phosphodiesterase class II)